MLSKKAMKAYCCLPNLFLLLCFLVSTVLYADTLQPSLPHSLKTLLQTNPDQIMELDQTPIKNIYKQRDYQPLWSDADGMLDRAFDLLDVIANAENEGLNPSDYYLIKIKEYWTLDTQSASTHLDLLLTAALLRYSNDVYSGRLNPLDLDIEWYIEKKPLNIHSLFIEVASNKSIAKLLSELPPQHSGYQSLKKHLQDLRKLKSQGEWHRLQYAPILRTGKQHKQVIQLRQRLIITDDLAEESTVDIDIFDYRLAEAVKNYQARHGLTADSIVGPQTRRSLNTTIDERIRQIKINMERWRWMPRKLGKRYLMVNMTGFELYIMDNGSPVLTMPVIVGRSFRSTPSFSGLISQMEYNPYWTVPTNIVLEDMIPQQMKDPSYFNNKSIKLFRGWGENAREIDPLTVDWGNVDKDHFPYWLRQEPGEKNSLGRVKFLFSNPYEIYLHGTPDKYLFDRVVRTFSSGCIRVKDPVRLAAYLLNDGSQQREEEILSNIYLDTNHSVILPVATPIYLVYWTAWVDQDGRLNFRDDIYGRDSRLNRLFDD